MNLSKSLFEIAKKDLKAAKCLYEKKLYPQSVFYLEQSVEKATKSFELLNKTIKKNDLIRISHNLFKMYGNLLSEHKKELDIIKEKIPQFEKNISKIGFDFEDYYRGIDSSSTMMNSLSKDNRGILCIPKKEIRAIIKEIRNLESAEDKVISMSDTEEIEKSSIKIISEIFKLNKLFPKEIKIAEKELRKFFKSKSNKRILMYVIYVNIALFLLSYILVPHAVITRYPDKEYYEEYNPLKIYNRNLPLIQLFNKLVEIVEKTLSKMERLRKEVCKYEIQ